MEDDDEMARRKKVFDETTLLKAVVELCRELGLLVHHCNDSRTCSGTNGLPDLIIVSRDGCGVVFAELKGPSSGSYLNSSQQIWKWALISNGQTYQLWRPNDWHVENIQNFLTVIA
jgi:hypothetical protein